MHPVLLRWGRYPLYTYSALLWLGILIAVGYALWKGRRAGYGDLLVLDGALWALAGGLIGARAAYVIPNWADYAGSLAALFDFWGGGLVFQGGLLGGALMLLLYSLYAQVPFLRLADLAAPAVALAQGLGWAGALIHGANYGVILRSPLSMWLPDLYGIYGPRLPTQLLACMLGFLTFYLLYRLGRLGLRPGVLAMVYLIINGTGHFLLEFTRADEAAYVGLLRMTQVAALTEAVLAAGLLYLRLRPSTKAPLGQNGR